MDRRTIIDAATRLRAAELYDERPMAMGRKYARYSYETKLAAARTVVDGGMTWAEAMEGFGIASTTPLKNWVRAYREGGPEALRPKPRGRPAGSASPPGSRRASRSSSVASGSSRRRTPTKKIDRPEGGEALTNREKEARGRRPDPASDMGWRYQQAGWRGRLEGTGIVQSMSRKGNRIDNGATEQVFGHMKYGFFRGRTWADFEPLKADLGACVAHWNTRRRQVKLKGLAPEEFRNQSLRAA